MTWFPWVQSAGGGSGEGATLLVYGGMYVQDGATPQAISTTPVKLTGFTNISESKDITFSAANDNATITEAGVYTGICVVSFSGSANTVIQMHLRVDGVEQPEGFHRELSGGDVGAASFVVIPKTLAIGEVLDIYVEADADAKSVTVVDAQFILFRIG